MTQHHEAQNRVSVWIGEFSGRDAFDAYLREDYSSADDDGFATCPLWKDMGVTWHDHDFQEATFVTAELPLRDLLVGFSWIGSFSTDLLNRCRELGIVRANAVVVLYECDFSAAQPFSSLYVRFAGSFQYSTDGVAFRRDAAGGR